MEKQKYELYYVGGYVRDKILGIQSKDIDFTFVINEEKININDGFQLMHNWLVDEGFTIFLSTPDMLTIRAKFPKNEKYINEVNMTADFVLATKKGSTELGSLEDDLLRRDFTVNAIAMDMQGNLIDICNGVNDIKNKILRTPINPIETFEDDPLRILRGLRFNVTKEFKFHPDLFFVITNKNIIEKLFTDISIDRIREELNKMFLYSTPKSLEILNFIEVRVPGFINKLFTPPLHLIPSTKN